MDLIIIVKHYVLPSICAGSLVWLGTKAYREFYAPSKLLIAELTEAIKALKQIKKSANSQVISLEEIKNKVMVSETLNHLWGEYCETLHPQQSIDENGVMRVNRYRSTTMAETFFTEQALVDTPLQTEFFKNLPGIFTGIGIIGTFLGLIVGLNSFEVTSNAEVVRTSLRNLLQGVGEAFYVSCFAIFCAMVFTFFEKTIITECYKLVEEFCQLTDSLFDAGAGEEYLARLVMAAETSATQASQIKDALVADLKQILTEVTELQLDASAKQSSNMSTTIVQSFTDSISGPMEKISRAVENVGANQGDAVNRLLTDVLSNFASQMENIFGGQLRGINELLSNTSETIQSVSTRFEQVAGGLQSAGEGAADAMAEKLTQAITAIEARQEVMNANMGEFVTQMRDLVQESQSDSAKKMQSILGELGEKVSNMVAQLDQQSRDSSEVHRTTQTQFAENTTATIGEVAGFVQTLAEEVRNASDVMRTSVAALSQTSRESIDKLSSGADVLYMASSDFAKAGQGVTETIQASGKATSVIQSAGATLAGALVDVKNVLRDNERTRDIFAKLVSDLQSTVENTRTEASLTANVLSTLREASQQLGSSQKQAEIYLKSVTEVLGEAHQEFAKNIEQTLRHGNTQFHIELSDAVSLLNGAIKDLGDTLESATAGRA